MPPNVLPFGCPPVFELPVLTTSPIEIYIGDDPQITIFVTDQNGDPSSWTGCAGYVEIFTAYSSAATPIDATWIDLTTDGEFTFTIPSALTGDMVPQTGAARSYPTRAHAYVIDALTRRTTVGIVPLIPLKP